MSKALTADELRGKDIFLVRLLGAKKHDEKGTSIRQLAVNIVAGDEITALQHALVMFEEQNPDFRIVERPLVTNETELLLAWFNANAELAEEDRTAIKLKSFN